MSLAAQSPALADPVVLGRWIATHRYMWQMEFLTAEKLARFARDRGLSFSEEDVIHLWQLGLLRADLIVGRRKVRRVGLVEVGSDARGRHLYADARQPSPRRKGWAGATAKLKPLNSNMQLLFHPFRYYVLYYLDWVLSRAVHMSPMGPFISAEGSRKLLSLLLTMFKQWSGSSGFQETADRRNDLTALVVAAEPCMYQRLFGNLTVRHSLGDPESVFTGNTDTDFKVLTEHISQHWEEIAAWYRRVSVERLEGARQALCVDTQRLDPNRNIHTLIRLSRSDKVRLELEGRLGGAMHLRTMAEILRRATEQAHGVQLREEDELGFGWVNAQAKIRFYGTDRLLDGNRTAQYAYVRRFGLDSGLRLRWYVEGETERHALLVVFGGSPEVDVINLYGHVVQKNRRGVGFRDSLRSDVQTQVFSYVSIDGDRGDYRKMVEFAATDDDICGGFFIATPDFEFGNFELAELEEILWSLASDAGSDASERPKLQAAVTTATSAKTLLASAASAVPELLQVTKGKEWGVKLMDYALNHPEWRGGQLRPIIEAVQSALRLRHQNYYLIRNNYQVDSKTGRLVKRSTSWIG